MRQEKNAVLVTGVWDLLHQGHLAWLRESKRVAEELAADKLLVGVELDERVRQMKGDGRPVIGDEERRRRVEEVLLVEGNEMKAEVVILPQDFDQEMKRRAWLQNEKVRWLIIREDDERRKNKEVMMRKIGGKVIVKKVQKSISTTGILAGRDSREELVYQEDEGRL